MRKLFLGALAIVLFAVAAVGGIWALTRDGSPGPAGADASPASVAPPPLQGLPGLAGSPSPSVAPPPQPEVVQVYAPPRVEPPKDSWEAVAVVARPSALGPVGGAIGRGLIELQPQLAACFDEYTAARFGPQPRSVSADPSLPDGGNPVLVLQIETGANEARIVDAPVDTQGRAEDGVVSCAQSVLRGRRFPAPGARPGERYRVLHSLIR